MGKKIKFCIKIMQEFEKNQWNDEEQFSSPDLDGGRFTVVARPTGGGQWQIISDGEVSRFKYHIERIIR